MPANDATEKKNYLSHLGTRARVCLPCQLATRRGVTTVTQDEMRKRPPPPPSQNSLVANFILNCNCRRHLFSNGHVLKYGFTGSIAVNPLSQPLLTFALAGGIRGNLLSSTTLPFSFLGSFFDPLPPLKRVFCSGGTTITATAKYLELRAGKGGRGVRDKSEKNLKMPI